MAWVTLSTAATWGVTDLDLLKQAEYALLESGGAAADGTFATAQFTVSQFVSALQDRQRQFLLDTAAIIARASEVIIPETPRYALPADWIATRRASFQLVGGRIFALFRTDAWQADHALTDWEQSVDLPFAYHESTLPTAWLELVKAPSDAGTLYLTYVPLPTAIDGSGLAMSIPDEFCWVVYYGALADLFSADGEGNDPQRAQYCQARYDQGVELARLLLGSATPAPQGAAQ